MDEQTEECRDLIKVIMKQRGKNDADEAKESATEKSKYLHSMLTTLEKGSLRH